ncbi:MAG: BGTF surface domain-containing protein, partial [Halanaeroarchaeum sp.]
GDELQALTVENEGSIPSSAVQSVTLRQNGTAIARAETASDGTWTLVPRDSAEIPTGAGTRFAIEATLASDAPVGGTLDLSVSGIRDGGVTGAFEAGDRGLFLADGAPLGGLDGAGPYTIADPADIGATATAYPRAETRTESAVELAFTDDLGRGAASADDFVVTSILDRSIPVTGLADDDGDDRLVLHVAGPATTVGSVAVRSGALSVASGAAVPSQTFDLTRTSGRLDDRGRGQAVVFRGERFVALANDTEPGRPHHDRAVTVEVRAGSNGSERFLFAGSTGPGSLTTGVVADAENGSEYRITFGRDGATVDPLRATVRPLSLEVRANRTNTTDVAGPIRATVNGSAGGRAVRVVLLDRDANRSVIEERVVVLDDAGNGSTTFAARVGNFSIQATDLGTNATAATDPLAIREGHPGVTFVDDVFEEEVGDVARLAVRLVDATRATLTIGGDRVNYRETLRVVDRDEDGRVTVGFNTHVAGTKATGVGIAAWREFARPVDRGPSRNDTVQGLTRALPRGQGLSHPLETGEYPLTVSVDGEVTDLALLSLGPRRTNGVYTLVAPAGVTLDTPADIANWTTRRKTIAIGDQAIVAINASGLDGILGPSTDLRRGSRTAERAGVSLSVAGRNPPPNRPARRLNVSNATGVVDFREDRRYRVFPSSGGPFALEAGDAFEATFTVAEGSSALSGSTGEITGRERANATLAFVRPTGRFEGVEGGTLNLTATADARIAGETNVAPGTVVTVDLTAEGGNETVTATTTTRVDADGTFETEVDLSSVSPGTTYTVVASANGDRLTAVRTGTVREAVLEVEAAPSRTTGAPPGAGGGGGSASGGTGETVDATETTTAIAPTTRPPATSTGETVRSVSERAATFVTRDVPQFIRTRATTIVVGLGGLAVLYGFVGLRRLAR